MSKLSWYWHRLRAMSPGEVLLHARKRWRQSVDASGRGWPDLALESTDAFPRLPKREDAPESLREALRRDADEILAGRWLAFGHLELKVDDPPKWHCDYLAGRDLATQENAFTLDHRALPGGADIKLIWELSRWQQLTRLAQAAYVLGDQRAAEKCLAWLEDWVKHNPPYRGWNWTSALESGLRLIQFTWIDALLMGNAECRMRNAELESRLARLRRAILPPHVWFIWRHRSFGSSANNHLLGELAGLITATVRWPELHRLCTSLDDLQGRWAREVMKQFAEDGGNKEQALHYHLFTWELCWQAFSALQAAKRQPGMIEQRLSFAARFFWEAQARTDQWDYGDSDNATVVPFFARADQAVAEWHLWFETPAKSVAIGYWLGNSPSFLPPIRKSRPLNTEQKGDWWLFRESGLGICESGFWWLRWDLSPQGYLATAAHGHLDALHFSIWRKGVALVIDPGTGAYYADPALRTWLASRAAHNAPCPSEVDEPRRLGPFLWSRQHLVPEIESKTNVGAALRLLSGVIERKIQRLETGDGWLVTDVYTPRFPRRGRAFTVRWQFAPDTIVKQLGDRRFIVKRHGVGMEVQVSESWSDVELVELDALASPPDNFEGIVSPAFRKTLRAPFLKLTARPTGQPCVFSTRFLACGPSNPADPA